MSQARALHEINRFLSSAKSEVLSISGRWGVGKTHAWDAAMVAIGEKAPLPRYAYASVFGLRSLEALKTAIVQSTVKPGAKRIEPTIDSFYENLSSLEDAKNLLEQGARRGGTLLGKLLGQVPHVGKLADLLTPGAALLIRNQIICIDDIERAGHGLDVADVLGLVSMLKERRGCKIVLLLNEEGLGKQAKKYRQYLEKVVDQAISFEPTPTESAAVAFEPTDALGARLGEKTTSLGIINIRVIRKTRMFLSHLEPMLVGLHDQVTERVVQSIALLGWCVFEPKFAPDLERIRKYRQFAGLFGNDKRTDRELRTDAMLSEYGFSSFEDVDQVILSGLRAGAFDPDAFRTAVRELHQRYAKDELRLSVAAPWAFLGASFEEDLDGFAQELIGSIEKGASAMAPNEASDVLTTLRGLGREADADRLLPIYVEAQKDRPRDFFAWAVRNSADKIDTDLKEAFRARLETMPLERDPGELLLEIARKDGWNPDDVAYLASVPIEGYHALLKRLRGSELHDAIRVARRFGQISGGSSNDAEIARRMDEALRLIAGEGPLNAMRVRHYVGDLVLEEPAGDKVTAQSDPDAAVNGTEVDAGQS